MHVLNKLFWGVIASTWLSPAAALPIGFGINQGKLDYNELKSDHFIIYHDARVPGEGKMVLHALEAVRPTMERWFKTKRGRLPVVMSAVTDNASFANFLTDAIELQTMGMSSKDLAWHEYVHTTMYGHFSNIFGHAGAIIHLPWMPAWFIEGLAESLSVSVGSDTTAGIERYQALTGSWPSYDRLHSLYAKAGFSERGYATSGAFTTWLLRQGRSDELPRLLSDFYDYSMPWWWPVTIVPWKSYLPFDRAIRNYTAANYTADNNTVTHGTITPNTAADDGEQLYERYKKAAAAHWTKAARGPFLLKHAGSRRALGSVAGIQSTGSQLLYLQRDQHKTLYEMALTFDPHTGWATGWEKHRKLPSDFTSYARISSPSLLGAVEFVPNVGSADHSIIRLRPSTGAAKNERQIPRPAYVFSLHEGHQHVFWLEQAQATVRLCSAAAPSFPSPAGTSKAALRPPQDERSQATVECLYQTEQPRLLRVAGERRTRRSGQSTEIWLSESEERLQGTLYRLRVFDTATRRFKNDFFTTTARPINVAFAGGDIWVMHAERNHRTLRRYNALGQCEGMLQFQDHLLGVHGLDDGSLAVALYGGSTSYLLKLSAALRKESPCTPLDEHTSPLLYATRHPHSSLSEALAATSLWRTQPQPLSAAEAQMLTASPPIDHDAPPGIQGDTRATPAAWRGRPLFAFPWIGADDALGPQLGLVSLPLVDHMQNETLRATFLYGAASRFPYQELSLTSTRYAPTLNVALYRQQTYNGAFLRRASGEILDGYLDEKGGRVELDYDLRTLGGAASIGAGFKYAHLKPYIGPEAIRKGYLAEPTLNLGIMHSFYGVTWSNFVAGRVAPEQLNEAFDYNQLGVSTNLGYSLPFWSSHLSLGLEGSRTRGKKRRELQEVYRPLKTFVPGSGGGYNRNSFPIAGESGGGLFSGRYGDTQARAKANWTMPLIADVDKLVWILYLERLDFTAFYNYGGAWTGTTPSRGWDNLTRAHGYNVDLQLENKGVRFNIGLGTGQVVGRSFEAYLTSGFDALF